MIARVPVCSGPTDVGVLCSPTLPTPDSCPATTISHDDFLYRNCVCRFFYPFRSRVLHITLRWLLIRQTAIDPTPSGTTGLRADRSNNRRNQFRPRPGGKQGTTSYQLRQYAEATLGGGSLRKIVKLPEGEDENEWYAVNSKHLLAPHCPTLNNPAAY